ncbi:hypothetical protein PHMEG_00011151 [Phytophthora megakarya]|uniref:Uncharacterized protein n=1 Tax=Phytophthora megakarya TaxID=4795 RepID=A0A225WCW2_9STRA|nr:hypothetical protein PHMEG_00011151 [Phytophthora megakarya]
MKLNRVRSVNELPPVPRRRMTAQRILMVAWFCVGMVPLLLQIRSYLKFMAPHKITETVVEPPYSERDITQLDLCPIEELYIARVRWNIEATYFHEIHHGRLCHFVVPQYNIHGNYLLGPTKTTSSSPTPEYYFYHGSIGYFAFYEEAEGAYCAQDKTAYVHDTMNTGSYGGVWLLYRVKMRCYISCKRYGRRCDFTEEPINRWIAVVYVQENMRLTAHERLTGTGQQCCIC